MDRLEKGNIGNSLSLDLEHWHSATLVNPQVDDPADRIKESLDIVLDLLSRHGVSATFFTLGEIADEYPDLISQIADEGHEIASHGYSHTPLFDLKPDEFDDELSQSEAAIRRATGRDPIGFRAPNFSITPETAWAFEILESRGYVYDSSVFPVKTPMYGVSRAPIRPYRVAADSPFEYFPAVQSGEGLIELPLAVLNKFVRIPISGGFYGRLLPVWVLERGLRRLNHHGIPVNVYFHPWEFNPKISYNGLRLHRRFISSYGTNRIKAKLNRLLQVFDFQTIEESLAVSENTQNRKEASLSQPTEGE